MQRSSNGHLHVHHDGQRRSTRSLCSRQHDALLPFGSNKTSKVQIMVCCELKEGKETAKQEKCRVKGEDKEAKVRFGQSGGERRIAGSCIAHPSSDQT